jgi:transcriptional regulator with XRE-family HTH domain
VTTTPEYDDDQAVPAEPPSTEPTDRRAAARTALDKAVRIRGSVRRVHDAYAPDRPERRITGRMLRALDGAVCRQIYTADVAGLSHAEIARLVGVNRSRVGHIVRRERERAKQAAAFDADAEPADVEPDVEATVRTAIAATLSAADAERATERAALVNELRAADAERAAVRDIPRSEKQANLMRYDVHRRAAHRRLCLALHAAHDDGMTLLELAAVVDLGTSAIRRILANAY